MRNIISNITYRNDNNPQKDSFADATVFATIVICPYPQPLIRLLDLLKDNIRSATATTTSKATGRRQIDSRQVS